MTAEEKAREFLDYVGRHHERLRKNLAKNITFDRELFENTFQDTVVRVHDAILRNDPDISDFEKYFFMASRKWYITLSGRRDRKRSREIPLGDADCADTASGESMATVEELRDLLSVQFGKAETDLFLDYLGSKTMGRISYSDYGFRLGIPSFVVKDTVLRIKRHLRERYPRGLTSGRVQEEKARILSEKKRRRIEDGLHTKKDEDNPKEE